MFDGRGGHVLVNGRDVFGVRSVRGDNESVLLNLFDDLGSMGLCS